MSNEQRYGTGFGDDPAMPPIIRDDLEMVELEDTTQTEGDSSYTGGGVNWSDVDCLTKQCEEYVEVILQDPNLFTNNGIRASSLSTPFLWRGVEWTVLVMKKEDGTLHYFLGIEDTSKLPVNFLLSPQFTVAIIDDVGNVVSDSTCNADLRKPKYFQYCATPSRDDFGQADLFRVVGETVPGEKFRESVFSFYNDQTAREVPLEATADSTYTYNAYGYQPYQNQYQQLDWTSLQPYRMRLRVQMRVNFTKAIVPFADPKTSCGVVGILNLGATCYLNALLQMLFHIDGFRRLVFAMPHQTEIYGTSTTLGIQEVFKNLQFSRGTVDTRDLLRAFGWGNAEAFMQQDVQEMMRVLLDKIEEKAKDTVCDGRIKDLFGGTVRSFISCTNVKYESKREEEFYDIQLDVKDCANMHESFKRYTESEMLEGDNQYDAGPQFGKQDAKKGVIFTRLPPVLTIHLKRFDFDLKHMGYRKIHDHFAFPTWTNLDSFLAPDAPEECLTGNDYILHSVLVHSGDFGGGHYYAYIRPMCDSQSDFDYMQHAQKIKPAADNAMKTYAAENAFVEQGGDPLRDPMTKLQECMNTLGRGGKWYKFDDENVYAVEDEEAVDYCFGRRDGAFGINQSMASAYMLLYIRASAVSDVMRKFDQTSNEDIPKSLVRRLSAEVQSKRLQLRLQQQTREGWATVSAFTKESLHQFEISDGGSTGRDKNNNNIFSMLLASKMDQQVLYDSRFIRLHIKIAKHLNVSPFRLCLYQTSYTKIDAIRRFGTRLTSELLGQTCDWLAGKILYVYAEVASDTQVEEMGMWAEDRQFETDWAKCQGDERDWIIKLRNCLYFNHTAEAAIGAHAEGSLAAQAAAAENHRLIDCLTTGYGIGSPDTWKELVKETNSYQPIDEINAMIVDLESEINRIEAVALDILQRPGPFVSGPLLILKVFDPAGAFNSAIVENNITKITMSSDDNTTNEKQATQKEEEEESEDAENMFVDTRYRLRTKYFKFLTTTRVNFGAKNKISSSEEENRTLGDKDDAIGEGTYENALAASTDNLVSTIQSALQHLPGLSPELLLSIPQWKLYLGHALRLNSEDNLSAHVKRDLSHAAVIVIDPGFELADAPSDPATLMNPGIDDSYEVWSNYVVSRIPLKCAMLDDKHGFNSTALRALIPVTVETPQLGTKRVLDADDAEEAPEIPSQFSRFVIDTTRESTFRDLARFVGFQLGVEPNRILLWVVSSDKELEYSSELDLFSFHYYSTGESQYVKGGVSEPIPESVHKFIYYSIAPFSVVKLGADKETYVDIGSHSRRFCFTVTDARLSMWRRLKSVCVHKELVDRSLKLRKRNLTADNDVETQATANEALIAFNVDADMLSRVSADCAMLSSDADLNLMYSRAEINALCDMPPEQRELHLMESYVFFQMENDEWTVGDLMEKLHSVVGIPTNAREVLPSIISSLEYACTQSENLGNGETPPSCNGSCIESIDKCDTSVQSMKFAQARMKHSSSVLNFFSEPPPDDVQANIDSFVDTPATPWVRDVKEAVEANLRDVEHTSKEFKNDLVLALLDIRSTNNTIFGVYFHKFPAVSIHTCWPEAASKARDWPNLWQLGVQAISVGDIPYLCNSDRHVRSMAVQVLSFRGTDSVFASEYAGTGHGHVLTYVRQDDTYARLAARVATLIGDSNALELDMYAVQPTTRRHQKPRVHSLPRQYKRPRSEVGISMESSVVSESVQIVTKVQGDESMQSSTSEKEAKALPDDDIEPSDTIWATFKELYPSYATRLHHNAKLQENTSMRAQEDTDLNSIHFPILALRVAEEEEEEDDEEEEDCEFKEDQDVSGQRPRSSSVSSAASAGLKRRKSSQIMIN